MLSRNSSADRAERLAGMVLASRRVVVLTGAGISTDSGIPDFRSPNTGLWQQYNPMEILSLEALYLRPKTFFTTGFQVLTAIMHTFPNTAHKALARMEDAGLIGTIITQNIDGLHQAAGSQKVLEVHGHLRTCRCMYCERREDMESIVSRVGKGDIPPRCTCGGIMRPDIILFGDPLTSVLDQAIQECRQADLCLVLGSSLTVAPVCNLPVLSKRMAIINRDPTPYDYSADFIWHTGISEALTQLEEVLTIKGAMGPD